ncbi:MAG: hypothetical protein ABH863_02555 [Candidatus Micrarchaeota archaeon]
MDFSYLGSIVLDMNFLMALGIITAILWVVMREILGNESFWGAIGLAFLALIFLPVMLDAMQSGAAFFLLLLLGGLLISEIYCWSVSTGVLVAVFALVLATMVLPNF